MKSVRILLVIVCGLGISGFTPFAQGQAGKAQAPKTLGELLRTRELWPEKVALTKELNMGRGGVLKVGQTFPLYEITAGGVVIDTGKSLLTCPKGTTDVLEQTRKLVDSLTPEQLALRMNQLPKKQELWPLRVKSKTALSFQNGVTIAHGDELAFRGFGRGAQEVSLVHPKSGTLFTAKPWETDLIVRARERLKLPAEKREPFFVRAVESSLDSEKEHPLKDVNYILLYRGRKACPRCSGFAPRLAEFYKRVKPRHPEFEAVYISLDASEADLKAHVKDSGFPGIPVQFGKSLEAANAATLQGANLLPIVHVVDRSGKVLAHTDRLGRKKPDDILRDLETLLEKSAKPAK